MKQEPEKQEPDKQEPDDDLPSTGRLARIYLLFIPVIALLIFLINHYHQVALLLAYFNLLFGLGLLVIAIRSALSWLTWINTNKQIEDNFPEPTAAFDDEYMTLLLAKYKAHMFNNLRIRRLTIPLVYVVFCHYWFRYLGSLPVVDEGKSYATFLRDFFFNLNFNWHYVARIVAGEDLTKLSFMLFAWEVFTVIVIFAVHFGFKFYVPKRWDQFIWYLPFFFELNDSTKKQLEEFGEHPRYDDRTRLSPKTKYLSDFPPDIEKHLKADQFFDEIELRDQLRYLQVALGLVKSKWVYRSK